MLSCKNIFISAISLILFNTVNTQAMVRAIYEDEVEQKASLPLYDWSRIDGFATKSQEIIYNSTWNSNLSLEENKKRLVDSYILVCLNNTFKMRHTNIPGVYIGKWDDSTDDIGIVFAERGVHMTLNRENRCAKLYSNFKERNSKFLNVPLSSPLLLYMKPLELLAEYKKTIRSYLLEIANQPVGCELFRRSIVKYISGQGRLERIRIIPVEGMMRKISYAKSMYVYTYLQDKFRDFPHVINLRPKQKYLLYSPKISEKDSGLQVLTVKQMACRGVSPDRGFRFEVRDDYPIDACLFTKLLCLLIDDRRSHNVRIADQRLPDNTYTIVDKVLGPVSIKSRNVYSVIFSGDKKYQAMYGLINKGQGVVLDLMNESTYLACKKQYIRPADIGSYTKFALSNVLEHGNTTRKRKLNTEEMFDFMKRFEKINGDYDLFRFYLYDNDLVKHYFEFGKGAYQYLNR